MIGRLVIDKAAHILLAAAPFGLRVILFGSQATQTADDRSDTDFLVVEPHVGHRSREMIRLEESLRPFRLPVDMMVLSSPVIERRRNIPNNVAYGASRQGKGLWTPGLNWRVVF